MFVKEDKWYYLDIMDLGTRILKILETYISPEGISKAEFLKKDQNNSVRFHKDALAGIRTRVAAVTGPYAGPLHYQGII